HQTKSSLNVFPLISTVPEEERDILANEGPQYQAVTTLPQEMQFQKLALNAGLTGRNAPHNLAFLFLETLRDYSRLQRRATPGQNSVPNLQPVLSHNRDKNSIQLEDFRQWR